ncbi:MAG: MFS transporter, partial [Bacteroides sp.]|nr:MFS transporter [Bacteroides sp.]
MTKAINKKLSDSKALRWGVLGLVAFTMFCAYFLTDVMAPLKPMLETELLWDSFEYGIFTSAYGWFNVFFLMLIFGGIILDKMGIRFTGMGACLLMIVGCGIKYYAVSTTFADGAMLFGLRMQVALAAIGYAIFGVGIEITGITVSKIIVKWFTGHELALAMGLEMAVARIGTMLALSVSAPLAIYFKHISAPVLIGFVLLCIGALTFFLYMFYDRKFDRSEDVIDEENEETFQLSDLKLIVTNKGFWLLALLCVLFYSAIFPFLKYATDLMIQKYNVDPELAGSIPSILPLGTLFLTPLFGTLYDRIGKGANLMIIGSILLIVVHVSFSLPILNEWWFATIIMVILGIA